MDTVTTRTQRPTVVGSSVLGVVYRDGVMLAADTMITTAAGPRLFPNMPRLFAVPHVPNVLFGYDGEHSDAQDVLKTLSTIALSDRMKKYPPKCASEMAVFVTRLLYEKRCDFDPKWNNLVIAGFDTQTGQRVLSVSMSNGTSYRDTVVATNIGASMAAPVMHDEASPDMDEAAARGLLTRALGTLAAMDCRADNNVIFAKVTREGVAVDTTSTRVQQSFKHEAYTCPSAVIY